MTKVGKVWSWLAARIRGSESSAKPGPPYKERPPVPAPKIRKKSRYSIVIIGESGSSRQIDLTTFRIRAAVGGVLAFLAVVVIVSMSLGSSMFGKASSAADTSAVTEKVKSLEDELQKKELALAVQKKRLDEMEQSTLSGRDQPQRGRRLVPSEERAPIGPLSQEDGPLTSIPESSPRTGSIATVAEPKAGESGTPSRPAAPGRRAAEPGPSQSPAETRSAEEKPDAGHAVINFNAQEVTAVAETANSGTLSFRLIKDSPNLRFSGYLFVFVEMADKKGENKIYAYPKRTRLGEGDLPQDYRSGESLSFKYNSRVELPFRDLRTGASLTRVSILLYGEDGSIVFQRGFNRSELKLVGAKPTNVTGERPKAGKTRQAL